MAYNSDIYNYEQLPFPEFIHFTSTQAAILYGSGAFIRHATDTNIQLVIPIGTNITPTIWYSPFIYLSNGSLNNIQNSDLVSFINQKDVQVLSNVVLRHDILIQYKITKDTNANFFNSRNIRCTLVDSHDNVINANISANNHPDTGQHDFLLISGAISHSSGDIVKIQFYLAQDNLLSDQSDTMLTIFRINWNISGLVNQ